MRFSILSLFIAGAVGVLLLGVPRAAHAVVAALVQVTNTAANPAITQSVSEQAQQLLQVECTVTSCNFIAPTGLPIGSSSIVTISPGQNFVITSVDIAVSACPNVTNSRLLINSAVGETFRASWTTAANTGTVHFAYPSGILIAGGTEFLSIFVQEGCPPLVDIFGYLTNL
jgi:hypothetical protein